MRKPNWDTEAGRQMWMSGKKDGEIADAFGISVHAVTSYRVKHWQQTMTPKRGKIKEQKAPVAAGEGVDPNTLDKIRENAAKAGIQLPGVKQEIATPPVAATPHQSPAAPASPQGEAFRVPRPRLDEMDIMAAATEHLSGMQAVCTACAIQALWFWTGPADLRRAKKNIDWLLDHMEG